MDKTELRQSARAALAQLSPDQAALFDTQITSSFLKSQGFMPQSHIACYMPLKGEVSCKSILQTLGIQGHVTCLPAVMQRDIPLSFRQYRLGEPLERGILGPMEPARSAREIMPDVILIPMLGFTRDKYRLGYGTGFYDRTLEALRQIKPVKTIGLAYSLQEIDDLPIEGHDIAMDIIITEKEIIT